MKMPASRVAFGVLLLSLVTVAGCAKRPALTQASAPAPTGAATTTAPPVQPAPAPEPSPAPPAVAPAPPPAAAPPPVVKEFAAVPELRDIHFDFDKYDIRPDAAKVLDANADWLKANATHLVLIEGHCDERGTNEYNLALGERRAKSAMTYLVSRGVAANRITLISYGEERPLCGDKTEACWARNRRAHFLVKPR